MAGKAIAWFVALSFVSTGYTQPARSDHLNVVDCSQATLARPGLGNPFRGAIANDDYAFSARVLKGYTGWGGVAKSAPFHGFTIFLDSQMKACINFDVHIRIDEDQVPTLPRSATPMWLGQAQAWQSIREGEIGNVSITNISTLFSFKRGPGKEVDDGEILLIAPTSKFSEAKRVYDAFIRSLKFDVRR